MNSGGVGGRVIELVEHARPVSRRLPDAVGRELAASRIIEAAPDPYAAGQWTLRAGSKVGAVRVEVAGEEPVTLRITPKVAIGRLFFLLGYSLDPRGWRDGDVHVAQHRELLPALAHAFERQVERALGRGLLQGYRATEDASLVVRGRIREAEQIRRRFGAALPVEIAYDEFTTDIAENRLLRAAVERLLRLPGVPQDVRSRLLHQRARLADVTPLVRGQELPRWRPTRLNSRYRHALHLARAILDGASAEHRAGALCIDGFLFDMNKLFEDFVCVALREAFVPYGDGAASRRRASISTRMTRSGCGPTSSGTRSGGRLLPSPMPSTRPDGRRATRKRTSTRCSRTAPRWALARGTSCMRRGTPRTPATRCGGPGRYCISTLSTSIRNRPGCLEKWPSSYGRWRTGRTYDRLIP